VIAFASGGIPEVIADGCTGFLVRTRTPEALAQRIRELLEEPYQLRRCAAAGRDYWRAHFTLERYRRQVLEQIEAAASGKAAPPGTPRLLPQAEPEGTRSG
jgi:glycosyltransferase involved in cell wall biosynthesis